MIVKQKEMRRQSFQEIEYLIGATGIRAMVTIMAFRKGQAVVSHRHPNEQVGYCLEGRFELTLDGESSLIEPGDSYAIPGNVPHAYRILEDARAVEVVTPPRTRFNPMEQDPSLHRI